MSDTFVFTNSDGCLVGSIHQNPHQYHGNDSGGWHFQPAITPCAKGQQLTLAPKPLPRRLGASSRATSSRTASPWWFGKFYYKDRERK